MNPSRRNTSCGTSRLPVTFSTAAVTSIRKLGPVAIADRMNRKNVEGQMKNPCAKSEGPAAQHSIKSAQRSLVEERKQRSDARQHRHQFMELMFKHQERRQLSQLPVAQQDRNVFQASTSK